MSNLLKNFIIPTSPTKLRYKVKREGMTWYVKRSSTGYYMEVPLKAKSGYWPTMASLREFCAENGYEIIKYRA